MIKHFCQWRYDNYVWAYDERANEHWIFVAFLKLEHIDKNQTSILPFITSFDIRDCYSIFNIKMCLRTYDRTQKANENENSDYYFCRLFVEFSKFRHQLSKYMIKGISDYCMFGYMIIFETFRFNNYLI